MAGATQNCCHLSAFCVHHTTMHHVPCHATSHKTTYNLPPALLAEWPGSFTGYCGNMGMEQVWKRESAQNVDPGGKHSPTIPAGTWTQNLQSQVWQSNHWAELSWSPSMCRTYWVLTLQLLMLWLHPQDLCLQLLHMTKDRCECCNVTILQRMNHLPDSLIGNILWKHEKGLFC